MAGDMYIIMDPIEIEVLSPEHRILSLQGPASADILVAAGLSVPDGIEPLGAGWVARNDRVAEQGFDLILTAEQETTLKPALEACGLNHALLRVATGERWSLDAAPTGGLSLLVLEGVATCGTTDLRESLGAGHLVIFDEGQGFEIINDGDAAFLCLTTRCREFQEQVL